MINKITNYHYLDPYKFEWSGLKSHCQINNDTIIKIIEII